MWVSDMRVVTEQWLLMTMKGEAEDILGRLTTHSSETLHRVMFDELIARVVRKIQETDPAGGK